MILGLLAKTKPNTIVQLLQRVLTGFGLKGKKRHLLDIMHNKEISLFNPYPFVCM